MDSEINVNRFTVYNGAGFYEATDLPLLEAAKMAYNSGGLVLGPCSADCDEDHLWDPKGVLSSWN